MKIFTGKVTALKMSKTATVSVERVIVHPLYKKRFRRDTKYQVHDELGVKLGDVVKFIASKPYSKTKKWKILEVVGLKKENKAENKEGRTENVEKKGKTKASIK